MIKQTLKTVPAQILPAPSEAGHYELPCGSKIYRSGDAYRRKDGELQKMPDAGRWFLWVRTAGKRDGFVPMTKDSIRYFDTPQEALQALQECREV